MTLAWHSYFIALQQGRAIYTAVLHGVPSTRHYAIIAFMRFLPLMSEVSFDI